MSKRVAVICGLRSATYALYHLLMQCKQIGQDFTGKWHESAQVEFDSYKVEYVGGKGLKLCYVDDCGVHYYIKYKTKSQQGEADVCVYRDTDHELDDVYKKLATLVLTEATKTFAGLMTLPQAEEAVSVGEDELNKAVTALSSLLRLHYAVFKKEYFHHTESENQPSVLSSDEEGCDAKLTIGRPQYAMVEIFAEGIGKAQYYYTGKTEIEEDELNELVLKHLLTHTACVTYKLYGRIAQETE